MARALTVPRTSRHGPWKHHIEDNEADGFEGKLILEMFDRYDLVKACPPR